LLTGTTVPVTLRVRDTDVILCYQGKSNIELDTTVFLKFIAADIVNNWNLRCPFCLVDYNSVTKTDLTVGRDLCRSARAHTLRPEGIFGSPVCTNRPSTPAQ
jgi:hypothetical protein